MARLKMALDFDEVCTRSHALIARVIRENHGHELSDHVYRYEDWENAPLTAQEYLDTIFTTPWQYWVKYVELIPGAPEGIRELNERLDIEILTARGKHPGEIEAVRFILDKHGFDFRIIGTAYEPKVNFLNGHALMLDDQIHELEQMRGRKIHRLLFRRPRNLFHWERATEGILPVYDWPHAVETVRHLLS